MVLLFKNVRERSTAKNYRLVSLPSVVSKIFEKLVNRPLTTSRNVASFLIYSVASGLLHQL